MSNSIWKTGDPTYSPDRYGDYYVQEYHREDGSKFYVVGDCCELNDRWAYLTDIIAQADKAERLQNQNSVLLNYLMDFMHREKEYVAQYKTAKSVSTINGYHQRIKDHLHEIGIDD